MLIRFFLESGRTDLQSGLVHFTTLYTEYLTANPRVHQLMAKKHLLPAENDEFLERLGMTEQDQKVYIATLDGGLVSAGELQQLTEINDLGQILESVRDLIDIGLIKKAQGMMPRYYATLPFFRETLSVEREFKFALEAMIQSLKQSKEETKQNRERIMAVKFPNVVDRLLDRYYKEILSPVISDLEGLKQEINDGMMDFIRDIDNHNEGIREEISLMLKPLQEYAQLQSHEFGQNITRQQGKLNTYIEQRNSNRVEMLKSAHEKIGSILSELKIEGGNVTSELTAIQKSLEDDRDSINQLIPHIKTHESTVSTVAEKINSSQKELKAELLVARQQVRKVLNEDITVASQEPGVNLDTSAAEERIDQIFSQLSDKIEKASLDPQPVVQGVTSVQQSLQQTSNLLDQQIDGIGQTKLSFNKNYQENIKGLTDQLSDVFNSLNQNDETSLEELKSHIEENVNLFRQRVLEAGENVREKINSHIKTIKRQQEQTLDKFQEQMALLYDRPADIIKPFLNNWVDEIEPLIESFKAESDEALEDILEPILKLEEETFSTLTERISFVRAMIEGRANDLQSILDFAKNFDYTKTADTWVVVGLPAIYASLTDQLLRSKVKVTVVTPHLDLELVELARSMKSNVRFTFVADIDKERDARLIKKIDEIGRITLRHYPKRDLYACIRDSEEIIFGYIKEGEKTVGLRASTPSIVELLEDRLNETVIRDSRPI